MKDKYISIIISLIALIISIISLCFAAYRAPNLQIDYMGVLIGILAILVTTLIGWQIFTFIDIKRTSKDLKAVSDGASNEVQKTLGITEYSLWMVYHHLLMGKDPISLEYRYLYHGIACLYHTSACGDILTCDAIIKGLSETINKPDGIKMRKENKDEIFRLLTAVMHKERITGYYDFVRLISRLP